MVPIDYQVVGEEDYALRIQVGGDGRYSVESGSYSTQPPRVGQLGPEQQQQLLAAVEDLGIPREHAMPEGATAFEARLIVGEPGAQAEYVFWEGALEQDTKLNALIRQLERL